MNQHRTHRRTAVLFALLLASVPVAPVASGAEPDFPRSVRVGDEVLRVGAPDIVDWVGLRALHAVLPVATADGARRLPFEATTAVDFEQRRVVLQRIRLGGEGDAAELAAVLEREGIALGLDALIEALPPAFEPSATHAAARLNFDPPRIIVSETPRRLLLIDGAPVMAPIDGTALEFVVNTDRDIFHDTRGAAWYMIDDGRWTRSNLLAGGAWRTTTDLPDDFLTLQLNSDWPQVAAALPPRPGPAPVPLTISYEPTELVLTDGPAEVEPIGSGLSWVANTERDLFLYGGRYYLLAAGRWFYTKRLDRQWFAVRDLPRAFAEIPADHPRARVLAAVPGTPAARRAAIEAAIPRVATVAPGAADALEVPWLGSPSFVPIEGTSLRRGENTPFQVIGHNNFYYLCHQGAWYASSDPSGPWTPAREIPAAIYDIPPTDPAFNTTFVTLDTFDPDSGRAAYVSTGGYYNRYYTGATTVYGTGWYTPGYARGAAYWRYPNTYGYHGPWGGYWPYAPPRVSTTLELDREAVDWEWDLDGNKRRVYDYGPRNRVGERYTPPGGAAYPND